MSPQTPSPTSAGYSELQPVPFTYPLHKPNGPCMAEYIRLREHHPSRGGGPLWRSSMRVHALKSQVSGSGSRKGGDHPRQVQVPRHRTSMMMEMDGAEVQRDQGVARAAEEEGRLEVVDVEMEGVVSSCEQGDGVVDVMEDTEMAEG
ncbi:hypothetical protein HDV05_002747, partial [Chytridiales sp. JEL 0842]